MYTLLICELLLDLQREGRKFAVSTSSHSLIMHAFSNLTHLTFPTSASGSLEANCMRTGECSLEYDPAFVVFKTSMYENDALQRVVIRAFRRLDLGEFDLQDGIWRAFEANNFSKVACEIVQENLPVFARVYSAPEIYE